MRPGFVSSCWIVGMLLVVGLAITGCNKEAETKKSEAKKVEAKAEEAKEAETAATATATATATKEVETKEVEASEGQEEAKSEDETTAQPVVVMANNPEEIAGVTERVVEYAAEEKSEKKMPPKKLSMRTREDRAKRMLSSHTTSGLVGSTFGGTGSSLGDALSASGGIESFSGGGLGGPGAKGGGMAIGGRDGMMRLAEDPAARAPSDRFMEMDKEVPGTENYARIVENEFKKALENPLSTFSIDVDTASYTNMRRFINSMNRLPPADAVRIEEFINYFTYDYKEPTGDAPFSVNTEITTCPWNKEHRLALIGLQGKRLKGKDIPASNLVFLLDVSGSMNSARKLGLLKQGFKLLVRQLSDKDRVAIVVYAGAAGTVLPSTPGSEADKIMAALDKLKAGGSTAGGAGIKLAYEIALKNYLKEGNNRVILATDGDFNVGASSQAELERMIEEKRKSGIFLTVLGFGMGNYKDGRMESLADKGNGNYAYIDNLLEAKKVLVTQLTGTLFAIAKDVKLQIEFNPTRVKEYRLIGYENRVLAKEDFDDDTKDAGELGSGHTVTALYEIIPETGKASEREELKYVKTEVKDSANSSGELMTVKLRYKKPDGDVSSKIEEPVVDERIAFAETTSNLRFATAAAGFGMLLRGSQHKGDLTFQAVLKMARGAKGEDPFGYRAEFIQMVEKADLLQPAGTLSSGSLTSITGGPPGVIMGSETPPNNKFGCIGPGCADKVFDKSRVKIRIGSVKITSGPSDLHSVINKYVRKRFASCKKCFYMVAKRNPELAGKVVVSFDIDIKGKTKEIKVIRDTTGEKKIHACLKSNVARWRFPSPGKEPVSVKVPMVVRIQ
jgi:Ca-activated chloride channel homolog